MNVLITAATELEISPVTDYLKTVGLPSNQLEINTLVAGIGGIATTYSLLKCLQNNLPGFIIQMGIAGSFDPELPPGSVVCVESELLGDMGAEESNEFRDLFELGLLKEDDLPFEGKILRNRFMNNVNHGLREVRAISINEITTRPERIELLRHKYNPVIESMEGAAFHYVCLREQIPFLQIRAISNYVGERNKKKWNIQLALKNLHGAVQQVLSALPGSPK